MSAQRLSGAVKFFDTHRGYGFITADNNAGDFFVHVTALRKTKINSLAEGQRVTFESEEGDKGFRAVNVKLV